MQHAAAAANELLPRPVAPPPRRGEGHPGTSFSTGRFSARLARASPETMSASAGEWRTVMGYERYPRGADPQGDYYNRSETQDSRRDDGSGRSYGYSSARDYEAAGIIGPDRAAGGDRDDGRRGYGARDYGPRDYGHDRYAQRDRAPRGRDDRGQGDRYGARDRYRDDGGYRGSYASDGRRFEDVGRNRHADDDDRRLGYGRQPQGYDYEERGFIQRAGDEVRSWFGDDDAERRREADARYDDRAYGDTARGGGRHDEDYHSWRSGQIAALDRDYDEYRRENRSRFENEFSTWRTNRQGQRDLLTRVQEHQEVVGADGAHVGTVDKVKDDRILLTRNDADAGGRHHSIPSGWITSVDDKVTLAKSAAEAKQAWRDEDRNSALFDHGDNAKATAGPEDGDDRKRGLNRSFSGTY
jgi:hypothetical protein